MKCLISILSHIEEPYISLENSIRKTWLENIKNDYFFYYGCNRDTYKKDDKLFLNIGDKKETLENIGYKTIEMFKYSLENYDYDFIFRTNSSSYIRIDKLNEYLLDKQKSNFCSAIIGTHKGDIKFLSGAGYFLSRDVVEYVVENSHNWNHDYIDDVALSIILKNYDFIPSKRYDLHEGNYFLINEDLSIHNNFHFRCKCNNRENDMKIFNKLYEKFK
jgi:hypothetical protein